MGIKKDQHTQNMSIISVDPDPHTHIQKQQIDTKYIKHSIT